MIIPIPDGRKMIFKKIILMTPIILYDSIAFEKPNYFKSTFIIKKNNNKN